MKNLGRRIRPAREEDLERIVELDEQCFGGRWPLPLYREEFARAYSRLDLLRLRLPRVDGAVLLLAGRG